MKRTTYILLLISGLFCMKATVSQAQSNITFSSQPYQYGRASDNTYLTDYYTFTLGSFGTFTPTAENLTDWFNNFTALGSSLWSPSFGAYAGTIALPNNNYPFATSNQGYVWGYNTQTIVPATEWLLLTNDNWLFPVTESSTTINWATSDLGTYVVLGTLNAPFDSTYLQTANVMTAMVAVPEPSTYALLTGLSIFCLVLIRSRLTRI